MPEKRAAMKKWDKFVMSLLRRALGTDVPEQGKLKRQYDASMRKRCALFESDTVALNQ
jgi:hypothetical protein